MVGRLRAHHDTYQNTRITLTGSERYEILFKILFVCTARQDMNIFKTLTSYSKSNLLQESDISESDISE